MNKTAINFSHHSPSTLYPKVKFDVIRKTAMDSIHNSPRRQNMKTIANRTFLSATPSLKDKNLREHLE